MTLLVLAGLVFAFVGGRRLLHIYLTSTGRQAADVPSKQDYPVRGVDLSYYQGNIDWDVLASQGVDFCFIKATEGIDHNDSQFAQNWETAQSAQIYVGAYHFFRFEDRQGAGGKLHPDRSGDGKHAAAGDRRGTL